MSNIIIHTSLIGTVGVQLWLIKQYFSVLFSSLISNKYRVIITYSLAGILLLTLAESITSILETELYSFVIVFIVATLYRAHLNTKILFSVVYLIVDIISKYFANFIIGTFNDIHDSFQFLPLETQLITLLMFSLMMLITVQIIKFFKRLKNRNSPNATSYIILIMTFLSFFLAITLLFFCTNSVFHFLAIASVLCIAILNICVFDRLNEKILLAEENRILYKQINLQDHNYDEVTSSVKNIKKTIHDINKHLLFLERCIEEEHSNEALVHIRTVLNKIEESYSIINTGHLVIDALVSHALEIAYHTNVNTNFSVHISSESIGIDNFDLCVLLGNVLENAVEALSLVEDNEEKMLSIEIVTHQDNLCINVVNSCSHKHKLKSKIKQKNIGFDSLGLFNIKEIVEKYGGFINNKVVCQRFETIIVLPMGNQ